MAAGARLRTLAASILALGGPAPPAGGQANVGKPVKPRIRLRHADIPGDGQS
jgi:hypothetical protein